MCGLGEMATWLPMPSGFTGYAARFCDPALGFAIGWTYVNLSLLSHYHCVWVTVFLMLIVSINYFGVRFFGESKFWLSSFKVTMVSATFVYLSTELVSVTISKAENPRKMIPRAIKLTFFQILFFYMISILLVGTLVPYNHPKLVFATKKSSSAAASPFVVAIELAGIPILPHILSACILLFVFSAANSDLYIATHTIYGLAREGKAPAIFARTDHHSIPVYALIISSCFSCLAYMNVSSDSKTVFKYFVDLVTIFGLLTWISLLVTHIHFVRARRVQHVSDSSIVYKTPFGVAGSYFALVVCCVIALTKSYDVFTHNKNWGRFNYKSFITAYLGIPAYLCLIFGYKLVTRCKGVKPEEADLWSGKDEIDREELAYLARKAMEESTRRRGNWVYETFVAWLF
ncbi:hypothetical protein CNMCM7691_003177 [Aspergillus felis]|uniref:Amino acid permease/ SLC12A domain-containing protein n=1 Tax=Aspergillus felis TaxID=1287682 RepID=A0A8H6R178_9EURO|nr:hypothetical protein CNMCM7691_003177 [Aspergillus felis]